MEVTEAPKPAPKITIGNEKLCKITEKASEKLNSLLTRQGRPNGALRLAVIGGVAPRSRALRTCHSVAASSVS